MTLQESVFKMRAVLGLLFLAVALCHGQKDSKYCAVCRVILSEAAWEISQVDPRKRIQVGSFRVDSKGNQNIKDKQYARSEVHIEEIVESVCGKLTNYAELTFPNGASQMVRTRDFDGRRLETAGFDIDTEKGKAFKYQCENFLEDHEEEVIKLLQLENVPDYESLICKDKLAVCTYIDLANKLFTLPVAKENPEETGQKLTENEDEGEEIDEDEEEDQVQADIDEDIGGSPGSSPSETDDDRIEL